MSSFSNGEQAISSTSSYVETYMDCKYICISISTDCDLDGRIMGCEFGNASALLRSIFGLSYYSSRIICSCRLVFS